MTTVSVVECISPISLRTCGSSVSSLAHSRRKLHVTSPTKKVTAFKISSPDLRDGFSPYPPRDVARDLGLEKALTLSPLQSPIPRMTPSSVGCISRNTIRRSPSVSSIESSDDELNDEIWRSHSPDIPENLFVVGSKPRLHGMWQVPDIISVTPSKVQQTMFPSRSECFDDFMGDQRDSNISPDNPPPSPVNFRAGMTGVVVGGHKLSYPERSINTPENCRDFTPGFVKKPLHHCLKCEGRVKEEELSQVTLHRRLSSILNNHLVQNLRHEEALLRSHSSRDFPRDVQSRDCHHSSELSHEMQEVEKVQDTRSESTNEAAELKSYHDISNKGSFGEIYAIKKREKEEREREMKEMRERRKEEKRSEEIKRLKEKLSRKNERSNKVLSEYREKQSYTRLLSKRNKEILSSVSCKEVFQDEIQENSDLQHLPPILKDSLSATPSNVPDHLSSDNVSLERNEPPPESCRQKQIDGIFADDKFLDEEEKRVNKMANFIIKKSRSDVFPCKYTFREQTWINSRPTEADEQSSGNTNDMADAVMIGLPVPTVTSWKRHNENSTETKSRDPSSASCAVIDTHEIECLEDLEPALEPIAPMPSTSNGVDANVQEEITMSATVIVPQRDAPCQQWITFNGDNEPVINNGPEKEDGCDTFLKRLQKSKLCSQNDSSLPSGQQFCFEAMVDKRYNRWKRRRRKKQSEARRVNVVQSSESSDENDDRNSAMERIIDKMYEQIHGPVPRTPNGSRETPRVRNRRRRKDPTNDSSPITENREQEPSLRYYDASSEWTSDGCLLSSSSVYNVNKPEVTQNKEKGLNSSPSDELCSWPYYEQYRTEILKRLQNTPPEQFEHSEQSDRLPEVDNNSQDKPVKTEVNFTLDANEETMVEDVETDTETGTENFEPYIRVDETPRQSPVSPVKPPAEHTKSPESHYRVDPESQTYSYKKWSRSQRSTPSKMSTPDIKPRLLSRMSASTWSDVSSETTECVRVVSVGDKQGFSPPMKAVKYQDVAHGMRDDRRSYKKSQKVAIPIKKHNVNLPSLTKNSRSQTVPYTGNRHSEGKPLKTMRSSQRLQIHATDDVGRSKKIVPQSQHKGPQEIIKGPQETVKEPQNMPDFLLRDFYLHSLYGSKVRMNSHIDSSHRNTRLRKTLTVDNLDLRPKKVKKKPADDFKPSETSMTRSFTFSIFDLPHVYKVYNDNLERRANGEDVEAYE